MVSPLRWLRGRRDPGSLWARLSRRTINRALVGAAVVLGMLAAVTPASAQAVVRESQCVENLGSNTMTYDCNFNVKNYVPGTPVTFTMTFACQGGGCGPVTSMGMRGSGFTTPGVAGHTVGGGRR